MRPSRLGYLRFHPTCLLLAWTAAVLALPQVDCLGLVFFSLFTLSAAMVRCRRTTLLLLRRSRWIFLSMVVLFLWMTPGMRAPEPLGTLGITTDGLEAAVEHAARLLLVVTLLALLLACLAHEGVIGGLYALLAPITLLGFNRRRAAVRLMLTLDYVSADRRDWRQLFSVPIAQADAGSLRLPRSSWGWSDVLAVSVLATLLILGLFR